ncbi:MAG: DNA-binding response regulator, partial [Coriobacteriia bacterium]|nr:DNA-binding response regulator [Coriobacteriia bacterium]
MIKAILVDDEAPARSELRFLLDEINQVEVVAEAANVREAIEQLKDKGADVLFLDISMPGATGLQLAEALNRLKYPPAIVFVTAHSEYGAKAFDVNAVDYLVKPVETDRLLQALSKVKSYVVSYSQGQLTERIPVEKSGKKLLVTTDKIHYIMAKDDYSYLHTEADRYLSTVSLAQLEAKLEPYGFFRVHR